MIYDITELAAKWVEAKEQERMAMERRRIIEDQMSTELALPVDIDSTLTFTPGKYVIKTVGRLNRKVDSERLQELASEAGLTDHLSTLFRWKPEIDMKAWKATDPSITSALADAITVTPGRPSFTITTKGE